MRFNYQGFFDISTLTRAYRYANDKKIQELSIEENNITAKVDGSRLYDVQLHFEEGKLISTSCNCPLENGRCKHAAAILIYMDELEIAKMQAHHLAHKNEEQ